MLSQTPIGDQRLPLPPYLLPSEPTWNMVRPSIICPGSRELPVLGQRQPVWFAGTYCTDLVCVCGNDCHTNVEYHRQVTEPLLNTDESAIQAMFSSFTTADPEDEDVWEGMVLA